MSDAIEQYLTYTSGTEVPVVFRRWSYLIGVSAFLGRCIHLRHGSQLLYPNAYCMLIGSPGSRKSTAIKAMKHVLQQAGYHTIAADKTSKEKFLLDMVPSVTDETSMLEKNLFSAQTDSAEVSEMLIAADEANDFFGVNNLEFLSILGNLWDYHGCYEYRIKNGKSFEIPNPTVSILSGNTPTGFAKAFPHDLVGQGFFSRILLIYGEETSDSIPFPPTPKPEDTKLIVERLLQIRFKAQSVGEYQLSAGAREFAETIYHSYSGVEDVRFASYANRRFQHLLKLSVTVAACDLADRLEVHHILYANTVLTWAEQFMPKAMGEFGAGFRAGLYSKIMEVLYKADKPINMTDILQSLVSESITMNEASEAVRTMIAGGKIITSSTGLLPQRKEIKLLDDGTVDYSILTKQEREMML